MRVDQRARDHQTLREAVEATAEEAKRLRIHGGLTYTEIAARMQLPESTVRLLLAGHR